MVVLRRLVALVALVTSTFGALAQAQTASPAMPSEPSGPVRLRQAMPGAAAPAASPEDRLAIKRRGESQGRSDLLDERRDLTDEIPYRPGEFELYVQRLAAQPDMREGPAPIRRFGAELVTLASDPNAADFSPMVPPDYLVSAGDEIVVTLWGSVDADVRAIVDRTGRITIPRVGPIMVAGARYADLADVVRRRVAQVFRNFDLSVSLGQLRGVRVYVTGFVGKPGAYSVSSLSTVTAALLRAGGPSAAGSFRDIYLRRGAQAPVTLDLYGFLLKGDRGADRVVQADDVIHVGPVGAQAAFIGSVNKPAVFELKAGETIADVLAMAAGFSAVADRSRVAVERLDERNNTRVIQMPLPESDSVRVGNGDVLRAFSAVESTLSVQRQNKRVRVDGEVLRPGEYVLPAASSLADALAAAGGLTPHAYVFGSEFSRESVRLAQQENYDRALRDLETDITRSSTTQRPTAEDAAMQTARSAATTRLIDRLKTIRPNGRIVLQVDPVHGTLPDLALEDGDRLYVPARPTTVGIFGSVFNGGSYLYSSGRMLGDYLRLAGGPTRGADIGSTFVIRANGSVVSGRQQGGWLTDGSLSGIEAQPGDTVFVPEDMNKTTFVQSAKDWTQILYQFGVGLAAIATFR